MKEVLSRKLARVLTEPQSMPLQIRPAYCPVQLGGGRHVIAMVAPGRVIYGLAITSLKRKPR